MYHKTSNASYVYVIFWWGLFRDQVNDDLRITRGQQNFRNTEVGDVFKSVGKHCIKQRNQTILFSYAKSEIEKNRFDWEQETSRERTNWMSQDKIQKILSCLRKPKKTATNPAPLINRILVPWKMTKCPKSRQLDNRLLPISQIPLYCPHGFLDKLWAYWSLKWTQPPEFKCWTSLFEFHFVQIP